MAKDVETVSSDALELAILGEGDYKPVVDNPEQQSREIVYRILNAESEDELFTNEATTSARDILGVPLRINGVRWNASQMENGPSVFAVIDAERLNGEGGQVLITCGSRNVMAQLYRAQQLNKMPLETPVKFEENKTASGFGALWLVAA